MRVGILIKSTIVTLGALRVNANFAIIGDFIGKNSTGPL